MGCNVFIAYNPGAFEDNAPNFAEEFLPKWPGFEVPVANVETASEGEQVGLAHLGVDGLEFLLEIEVEGRGHLVLVDSWDSLTVMRPGVSDAELQPTKTAARDDRK
jgi:hypothetical protein